MTTARLEKGTLAPAFTLLDQDERSVTLRDLRGGRVILFFYPEAMTPGCTKEACDFRDSLAPLQAAGAALSSSTTTVRLVSTSVCRRMATV